MIFPFLKTYILFACETVCTLASAIAVLMMSLYIANDRSKPLRHKKVAVSKLIVVSYA